MPNVSCQARIAPRTCVRVHLRAMAPEGHFLQQTYTACLPLRACVGAPQRSHTPW